MNNLTRNSIYIVILCMFIVAITGIVVANDVKNVQDERPSHLTCTYNEQKLHEYQPELQTGHLDVEPVNLYAEYCESNQNERDVAMYFAYYPVQEGVSSADSHRLDREPVYVFIDSNGEVDEIKYTAYHYIKGVDDDPNLTENNVNMYVVGPHNHYISQQGAGKLYDVRDMNEVHQEWYDNGWRANIDVTANPYEITNESSWWSEESTLDYRASEWYWQLRLNIESLFGDTETDID